MEEIKMDCERRIWKNWTIFSRCAIRDVAPLKLKVNAVSDFAHINNYID